MAGSTGHRLAAAAAVAALGLAPAAHGAAPPPPRISGSNDTIWSIADPTPSYTITGTERGARIDWRLAGSATKGTGASPLRIRLPGLATGTYRLEAAQAPGGRTAKRTVRVDITPPVITIRQPAAGVPYAPGQQVTVDFSCSGAVSCVGTLPDGAALPTAAAGTASFTVTAADAAGNTAAQSVSYVIGPVAPTITGRPAEPVRGNRPVFTWDGGEPGAVFTWQVLQDGAVVSQGDTIGPSVSLGPLLPGTYAFQVRQTRSGGVSGPFSVADPFTVTQAVPAPAVLAAPAVRAARRLRPGAGATVTSAKPLLSWRPVRRAALYNVQVFRVRGAGLTKVASVFPRGARTRVRGLAYGRRYAWRVWPYVRRAGYTRLPLGLSYFDLVRPVRISRRQMLVDRRVAEAAARRVAAIEGWLDAGLTAGDLRHEGLGAAVFDPGLKAQGPADAAGTAAASTRPVPTGATGTPAAGPVRVTPRELAHTRAIALAAVRRVRALEARIGGGLTGGDVVDGSIGAEKLAPGVALASARATTPPVAASVTAVAAHAAGPARIAVTRRNLLITQQLAQGAVRRVEALRARLLLGVSTADFRPGTIGSADLAPALRATR